jgi:hypothetical protein
LLADVEGRELGIEPTALFATEAVFLELLEVLLTDESSFSKLSSSKPSLNEKLRPPTPFDVLPLPLPCPCPEGTAELEVTRVIAELFDNEKELEDRLISELSSSPPSEADAADSAGLEKRMTGTTTPSAAKVRGLCRRRD